MHVPPLFSAKATAFCSFVVISLAAAQAGVFAHYSFDSDYADSSGNQRNGTLVEGLGIPVNTTAPSGGAPAGTPGNSGIISTAGNYKFGTGGITFSPDRDYVSLSQESFDATTAYSIAFWARVAAPVAGEPASAASFDLVFGDRSDTNNFIALGQTSTSRFRGNGTGVYQQDFQPSGGGNIWHHYAFVADGLGGLKIYVDNLLVTDVTGKNTTFLYDTIGDAYSVNTTSNDFDFHGEMDELWIFDEAITATAINALYTNNNTEVTNPARTLHHRYDGNFTDSSGQSNTGIPSGAAVITAESGTVVKGSGALLLDGADASCVTLTKPLVFSAAEPWSTAWWAKRDNVGSDRGMVMGNASNTTDFIWLNDSFSGCRFRSSDSTTYNFTTPKDTLLHHYVLVADGLGSISLYLDGALCGTQWGNTAFSIDSIGKAYPTTALHYNFKGSMDEIHVYENALSASEVTNVYQSEAPPANPPVTRLRIILLGGQSNADGRATISGLPVSPVNLQQPQADVDFFYKVEGGAAALTTLRPGLSETAQFGPEITLGRNMADLWAGEPNTRVAIIKYANGGTSLAVQWKGGGNATTSGDGTEYVVFQQTVTAGLAALSAAYPSAALDLQGMVWLQGESDAVAAYAGSYQTNLTNFITDVRATYGTNLPFIIARLSSGQTNLNSTYLNQVRAAQDAVAAADPRTGILLTENFGLNADNLHFNTAGQQAIGEGFALQTAYHEWMTDNFSAADINAGLAEQGADRDGDGQDNFQEFMSATNPTASTSLFSASFNVHSVGDANISYSSSSLRSYSVERYREIDGKWEQALPSLRGTGATVTRVLVPSGPRGLYRVCGHLP